MGYRRKRANPGKLEPLGRCCECGQGVYNAPADGDSISTSADVYQMFKGSLGNAQQEIFRVIAMNTRNRALHVQDIAIGGVNTVHVSVSDVLRPAIIHGAPSLIIVHNHPSGDPTPSPEDRLLTERISQAAGMMGIRLLDHIIISKQSYYSFSDSGSL